MFTPEEKKTLAGITFVVVARMLGLFLLLPVLAPYVRDLEGSTPILTGTGGSPDTLRLPLGQIRA